MDFPLATVAQFTDHLRALRKARGLTQAALGRLMGVSQSRIADIERDPGSVSVSQMHQLLSALGGQMILRDSGSGWTAAPAAAAPTAAAAAPAPPKRRGSGVTTGAKVVRNAHGPAKKPGGSW